MFIVHGTYRVAPRFVAYRNDWCNHCDKPVLAQQWRSFYVGHLYWIPLVPLGFYKIWRCQICARNPRERLRTSMGFIVAGLLVCAVIFVITFLVPYSANDAALVWGIRFAAVVLVVVFARWLNSRWKESPPDRIVQPLTNDRCLFCDGMMTDYPQWHCVECGLIRYGSWQID